MPQIGFKYPMKGLNQNYAASTQPSFTTAFLNNVRPYDVLENRARGGQRPGLLPMFQQILGYNYQDPTDCIALWHMDQNSIPVTADYIADQIGSVHLTASEAMVCENSPFGGCIIFDGDGYLESDAVSVDTAVALSADLTIAAWIKPSAVGSIQSLVSLWDAAGEEVQYELWLDSGTLKGSVGSDTPATYTATKTGVVASQWQLVVMTVSGTTVQVYLAAVAGTPATVVDAREVAPDTNKLTIAARRDAGLGDYFTGSICNIMMYDAALDADGVTALLSGVGQSVVDMRQVEFIEV